MVKILGLSLFVLAISDPRFSRGKDLVDCAAMACKTKKQDGQCSLGKR